MEFNRQLTAFVEDDIKATRDADMSVHTAIVCLMVSRLVVLLADEVADAFATLRLDDTKQAVRLLRQSCRDYERDMSQTIDEAHRQELFDNMQTLKEENELTLTQMFFCIKNELDKSAVCDYNDARAEAWRIVILLDVLRMWIYEHVTSKSHNGLSDTMLGIDTACRCLCGEEVSDTTRQQCIATARKVFENSLKRIKIEIKPNKK